jgi:hypothetical protein
MLPLVALLLALAAPFAPPQSDDPVIAAAAAAGQRLVGQGSPGLMRITALRGEGRTLIMEIALTAEVPAALGPTQIGHFATAGMCSETSADMFFSEGRTLQIRVTRPGAAVELVTIDRCPGPAGQAINAETFAAGMQGFVGYEDGEMRITSIRGEGNLMIVTVTQPNPAATSARSLGEAFLGGFCERAEVQQVFFGAGLQLRLDRVNGDAAPEQSPVYTACPPRSGG